MTSFDRVADRYDATRGYPEHVMEDILNALGRRLGLDEVILDAGVGTGRFAHPMQLRGYKITGIDIADRMLRKARQKGVENLVRGNLLELPFRDQSFDECLSVHVLHLISEWKLVLAEIGRVTKRNFLSVAFNKEESPAQSIRDAYDRICGELGYPIKHPGMRERELPDVVPPDTVETIVFHEHPVDVRSLIDDFETRTYSSQWTVPEEIHQQAIEALRMEFEGVDKVLGIEKISLIIWTADKLRRFS